MTNNAPKPPRKQFTTIVQTNEYAKQALEASGKDLERFMRNNSKLLSKANKSVYRQCKEISEKSGFILSQSVMSGIKLGKQKVCNTFIVYIIGQYWGVNGADMMREDFEDTTQLA